jgi:hypothetical protein
MGFVMFPDKVSQSVTLQLIGRSNVPVPRMVSVALLKPMIAFDVYCSDTV